MQCAPRIVFIPSTYRFFLIIIINIVIIINNNNIIIIISSYSPYKFASIGMACWFLKSK